MKVHLKTVLKLDKIGFSISILMVFYLVSIYFVRPHSAGGIDSKIWYSPIPTLLYAMIMSLLCGINVLKIGKIRKKYLKPHRRRYHTGLSRAEE